MLVASNKYDQDMFSNVIDKKNGCGEIGFPIVCLHYIRIKVDLSRKRNKHWKKILTGMKKISTY